MKKVLLLVLILSSVYTKTTAQQNWAVVPCSYMKTQAFIDRLFVDSLHNEIILNSVNGSTVCNTKYKGLVAYDGSSFHDLDKGFNLFDPNPQASELFGWDCTTYGNQTLFGGVFNTVGSDTLPAKGIALWNGLVWDTFPTRCFPNTLNNQGGGFLGFLKYQGKLWMYGGFDTIGNTLTQNLAAYDGHTFTAVPPISVKNNGPIIKMVAYKNKLIAGGAFYDFNGSAFAFSRLAQFDGTSWAEMDNGIQGSIAFIFDMAIYQDTLYISGAWNKADGNPGNYIVKWDGNHLYDAGYGGFCGYGNVRSLVPYHNKLYAFGTFDCAANQKAFGVAYYENGVWTVPQDSVDGPAIANGVVYNDQIYIGGGFRSINGDTTIHKFARLLCPDFDAATGCASSIKEYRSELNVKVFPNPSKDKLNLEFEQDATIDRVSILNTLGQEVYELMKPLPNQEIDISKLPAGIYFLKAENKSGQTIFKLVKQ